MNSRQKGLQQVRVVRKMLEGMGHIVEGPGYGLAFFGGSNKPVHRDYFGIADLISWDGKILILHQVTDLTNKSTHVRDIQEKGIDAWLWCKMDHKVGFRIFFITKDNVVEGKSLFKGDLI